MEAEPGSKHNITRVEAEPGICGFTCVIEVQSEGYGHVSIKAMTSECKQIQGLSKMVAEMRLKEFFMPLTENPVYVSAQRAGCHPTCPIPMALLKAVEAAMDMALPRDVIIRFES